MAPTPHSSPFLPSPFSRSKFFAPRGPLYGQWILITGVTGQWGKAIVQDLVQAGMNVVGLSRNEKALAELKQELATFGQQFFYELCDLSQIQSMGTLVKKLEVKYPSFHFILHNAFVEKLQRFEDFSCDQIHHILTVNLLAPLELTRLLLPSLKRNKGQILIMNRRTMAYNTLYSTANGGLGQWSHAMAKELKGSGIRIKALRPLSLGKGNKEKMLKELRMVMTMPPQRAFSLSFINVFREWNKLKGMEQKRS